MPFIQFAIILGLSVMALSVAGAGFFMWLAAKCGEPL